MLKDHLLGAFSLLAVAGGALSMVYAPEPATAAPAFNGAGECPVGWQETSGEYSYARVQGASNDHVQVQGQSLPPGVWEVQWDYYVVNPGTEQVFHNNRYGVRLWATTTHHPRPDGVTVALSRPVSQVWEDLPSGIGIVQGPATFYFSPGAEADRLDAAVNFELYFKARWRCPTGIRPNPNRLKFTGDEVLDGVVPATSTTQLALPYGPTQSPWRFNQVMGAFKWAAAAPSGAQVSLRLSGELGATFNDTQIHRWTKGDLVQEPARWINLVQDRDSNLGSTLYELHNHGADDIDAYMLWFINDEV